MKKIIAILSLAIGSTAFAGGWMSVDTERVDGLKGGSDSRVTYIRAGTEVNGLKLGLQDRTARFSSGDLANSLEGTVGKSFGMITPFVGVGRDSGNSTTQPFYYGLVGATAGAKIGPGFALAGVKTRVRESAADPKQTVTFISYSIPVNKTVAVNVGTSRSTQTINERGMSVGLTYNF